MSYRISSLTSQKYARSWHLLRWLARLTSLMSRPKELTKRLHNSQDLVNATLDDNLEKAITELKDFADPNSKDKSGTNALAAAVCNGNESMIRLLLGFSAHVQPEVENGKTVLRRAVQAKHASAVQILL